MFTNTGVSVFVSSVISVVLMEIRRYNRRSTAELEAQLSSDDDFSDIEYKKEK